MIKTLFDLIKARVFKEEEHPRASDGKFIKKGTGEAKKDTKKKDTKKKDTEKKDTKKKPEAKKTSKKTEAKKDTKKKDTKKKKTPPQKVPKMSTAKQQEKAYKEKAKAEDKAIKEAKMKHAMEAPSIVEQDIKGTSETAEQSNKRHVKDVKEYVYSANEYASNLDRMWYELASDIMKQPVSKRDDKKMREVAGKITEANDELARDLVLKMGKAHGLTLATQVNRIEGKDADDVIVQEVSYYADLLQSARMTMFETLMSIMTGSQKINYKVPIGSHVVNRIRNKTKRDIYEVMNQLPAPHEIRQAIADSVQAETDLGNELGRKPTIEEVAQRLKETSEAFNKSPIVEPPVWDASKGDWVASKKRIKDPTERLRVLQNYARQQKVVSLNTEINRNSEDKKIQGQDTIKQETMQSPEDIYEQKERRKELKRAIPKAMQALGLDEKETKVFYYTFGQPSEVQNRQQMTMQEVADRINKEGGIDGKKISRTWVSKYLQRGLKKIEQARKEKHPALEQLAMLKSFFYDLILKSLYEMNLLKSLSSWGLDPTVLEPVYTRNIYAGDMYELKKSLKYYERIGTIVTTDTGGIHARIYELRVPDSQKLIKAFANSLQKSSMFPHKGKSNLEVNTKALNHIKSNPKKYNSMASSQKSAIQAKQASGKALTWSEKLVVDEGGFWITWGGKRLFIKGGAGSPEVFFDSANQAHREEKAQGVSEEKMEFFHEAEQLEKFEKEREKWVREKWEAMKDKDKADAKKRAQFIEKNRGVSFDEDGNLQFKADTSVHPDIMQYFDLGVQAFQTELDKLKDEWDSNKKEMVARHKHKVVGAYGTMSEEERQAYNSIENEEDRQRYLANYIMEREGFKEKFEPLVDDIRAKLAEAQAKKGKKKLSAGESASVIDDNFKDELKALADEYNIRFLKNKKYMQRYIKTLGDGDVASEDGLTAFGQYELQRASEEANKRILDEGFYMVGNPASGKVLAVKVGHTFKDGNYTTDILEAFDPDGGDHKIIVGWNELGKELGVSGKKIQEDLIYNSNKSTEGLMLKRMSDEEFLEARKKTKLGLREEMLHKNFSLVKEERDKEGNVRKRVFAQDMEDGTQNVITVDKDGRIVDPIMARLINQHKSINNVSDLHEVLEEAVGNRAWIYTHIGSDIHIGDAVSHHIQLEYDGKGAPRVVGGVYDGYRFMDTKDIPKGAIDPATGEPIKAMFKNGKLIDRKFTTKEKVPMNIGNKVYYPGEKGKRIGTIKGFTENDGLIIQKSDGQLQVFKKDVLTNTLTDGAIKAQSNQVVVTTAKVPVYRVNTNEMLKEFASDPKNWREDEDVNKVKALFEEALKKSKISKAGFDSDGNLRNSIELSDSAWKRLNKTLGGTKLGKQFLDSFAKADTTQLQVHVPEHLRSEVEAEGVKLDKRGIGTISADKFERLRDILGGLSMTRKATDHLQDHFKRKDRKPKTKAELEKGYQPFKMGNTALGNAFRAQFKSDSFLSQEYLTNKDGTPKLDANGNKIPGGLYKTQLEAVSHLVERGRGIAGHGMGTGKTIAGVVSALHYKAQMLAEGKKPKKTLVIAPAGILSDWGKEIGRHTNSKALYIGNPNTMRKKGADGKYLKSENKRNLWGQDGTEQEVISSAQFKKQMQALNDEDHDFHIMSYEQFMRNKSYLAKSGMYDNIIIDEVHAFKNQSGKRGKSLAEATDSFKNVWGLSGTPIENDAREMHALIDTITGGRHELGDAKEFKDKFLLKDRNGKIIGVRPDKERELGDILANLVQFRGGKDVEYNDGSKIDFPSLVGDTTESHNPQSGFLGNMVDRSRDGATTEYNGTKHSVVDFDEVEIKATSKSGEEYTVKASKPKNMSPQMASMYTRYQELQEKYLPPSKLQELATASATGYDNQSKSKGGNYLTAMQKLQKFLNAPLADKVYVPGGTAIDSDLTDVQAEGGSRGKKKKKQEGLKPYNPKTGEGHYIVVDGYKRYFESDGKGGFLKNSDGSPKLLPPLHKNNPKADYLKQRIKTYLDNLQKENRLRAQEGKPELMPKVVVKSSYTTFGTDVIDGVLRDLEKEHPHLQYWADKLSKAGKKFGAGRFTGEADDREETKTGFRGNTKAYDKDQGNLWATSVSPAGKEGVDFGNAHLQIMYDQDWNPQKMAQFLARSRRSDSHQSNTAVGRENNVRIESLHMPGTVEDFLFNAQATKMASIEKVTEATREAEKFPRLGETEASIGRSSGGFTRGKRNKVKTKAKGATVVKTPKGGTEVTPRQAQGQEKLAKSGMKIYVALK